MEGASIGEDGAPAEAASTRAEGEGATLGEAKWSAMKELELRFPGLEVDHVEFETLSEEPAGARVAATADLAAWRSAEQQFDWPSEPTERVREILRRVTAHLGLRASVDVEEQEEQLLGAVSGSELGLMIGKHGQTIDAIQVLCGQAAFRGAPDRKRVVVDAGGYRERREAALRRQADRGVADALQYGRAVELDSMSAVERRAVHVYLRDRAEVVTHSEGDDPFRRVVISPARLADDRH